MPLLHVIVALLVQIFRRTGPAVIILRVIRVPLELASYFQIGLVLHFFTPLNPILDVIFTVCAIANKIALGEDIVAGI